MKQLMGTSAVALWRLQHENEVIQSTRMQCTDFTMDLEEIAIISEI